MQGSLTVPHKAKKPLFKLVVGFIVLSAAIVLVALAFSFSGLGCPLKAATGIPCPGCGMTRAWYEALHLNFAGAIAYHPLFWFMPMALAFALFLPHVNKKVFVAVMVGAAFLILAVWIIRFF